MSRNIILCADGTGNKGGHTPDSNVFKTYNAVSINDPKVQITYYDNGVGTSTNKFLKGLSGALGFGFQKNVRELYAFLSKNYNSYKETDTSDKIYLFGFSRGAATIRAFNGFLNDCQLIDARKDITDKELASEVKVLIKKYLWARFRKDEEMLKKLANGDPIDGCKRKRRKAKVEFIGVWDTVAALGMPKKTDNTGLISISLNKVFNFIDSVFNIFMNHREYNFQLTPNITRACQALAIDDARTSFWPRIWNEKKHTNIQVDQVWFAGMHSDVGGGYPRQAMSNVSLEWILNQASNTGLQLIDDKFNEIKNAANVHDKMHNSRDGLSAFYRYHPRDIESLCKDEYDGSEILNRIKIHESVMSRMYYRTAGYAPVLLPVKFDVVNSAGGTVTSIDTSGDSVWEGADKAGRRHIQWLKELYIVQLVITLVVVYFSYQAWTANVDYFGRSGLWGHFADVLQYILPDFFNNAVELWVSQNPSRFLMMVGAFVVWGMARKFSRSKLLDNALAKRNAIHSHYTNPPLSNASTKPPLRNASANPPLSNAGTSPPLSIAGTNPSTDVNGEEGEQS